MYHHNQAYPLLNPENLVPREQITLVPEHRLNKFTRAELANLKRGIPYSIVSPDTPENRDHVQFKTSYFQMVAYKEGWEFRPELYQVKFVNSDTIPETHTRIYEFEEGSNPHLEPLSPENRVGFEFNKATNQARRLDNDEADGIVGIIHRIFRR